MTVHKSTTYKPLPVPNPFREGQDKAYADILSDVISSKNFVLRVIGGGSLALFLASGIFFVYALSLQKTVPVLVNVMPSGETQYLGSVAQNSAPQIPEAAITYQIRKFVTNLRSVSTDSQVLYNNIDDCYSMITGSYQPIMTKFLRDASPFDLVGRIRRTVEIESILKITGSSYQVDWIESTVDTSANTAGTRIRALVTVKLLPTTEETIRKNPLGIYIENCEMTTL
jgi:type IV secretion system protein VirB5